MKRESVILLGIALAFFIAGCGRPEQEEGAARLEGTVKIPNPFTDCETLEEAQKRTGFSILLPESLETCPEKSFRVMGERMLEIICREGETEKARIRKGIGQGDVSGDYTPYSDVQQVEMDGKTLTLKGEEGLYSLAVWTEGEYSYAVTLSDPVAADSWKSLVLEMTEEKED